MEIAMNMTLSLPVLEEIKSSIYPVLLNKETNKELLNYLPSKDILDLAMIFAIKISKNTHIKITYQMLENWEITIDELYVLSVSSSITPIITPMGKVIEDIMCPNSNNPYTKSIFEFTYDEKESLPVYVVTKDGNCQGAGMFLHEGFLKLLAEKFNDDVAILPSSIHEILVLPLKDDINIDILKDMVDSTNTNEVSVEDRLSYSVYIYRKNTQKTEIF